MDGKSIQLSFVITLLLLSSGSGSIINVAADQPLRKVGVKVDDWAKYGEFKVTWSSNDTNAEPAQELIDANRTAWIHISVYKITLMNIFFRETTHFKNDTEDEAYKEVDVDSGSGYGVLTFVSAGLIKGDSLYSSEEGALLQINETISSTYVSAVRETNVLNLTWRSENQSTPPQVVDTSFIYFWDKATGITTERQASVVNKTGNYVTSWSRSDEIIDTNLWGGAQAVDGEPPYWIIAAVTLLIIVVGGLGVWLQKRSRSKARKSRRRRH